jgi:hypothetical protein
MRNAECGTASDIHATRRPERVPCCRSEPSPYLSFRLSEWNERMEKSPELYERRGVWSGAQTPVTVPGPVPTALEARLSNTRHSYSSGDLSTPQAAASRRPAPLEVTCWVGAPRRPVPLDVTGWDTALGRHEAARQLCPA